MQMGEKAVISDERHLKKVTTAILNLLIFSILIT